MPEFKAPVEPNRGSAPRQPVWLIPGSLEDFLHCSPYLATLLAPYTVLGNSMEEGKFVAEDHFD